MPGSASNSTKPFGCIFVRRLGGCRKPIGCSIKWHFPLNPAWPFKGASAQLREQNLPSSYRFLPGPCNRIRHVVIWVGNLVPVLRFDIIPVLKKFSSKKNQKLFLEIEKTFSWSFGKGFIKSLLNYSGTGKNLIKSLPKTPKNGWRYGSNFEI